MSGDLYYAETVGSGAAVFDYDNDGDLDVYLVQGAMLGDGKTVADATFPPEPGVEIRDRLFRNDLVVENGVAKLKFTEVTEASGIAEPGYGMGTAAADYDNDGWVDLYVTGMADNRLWRNNGDGTFSDVTAKAGVNDIRWSVSASFFDYDKDGFLDLYVGNYIDFSMETHKICYTTSSRADYCGPRSYNPQPDRFLRNRGDGTFEDVSAKTGISEEFGGALGIVAADLNLDGWLDIYVANDQVPNQMWIADGNGRFFNDALLAGVAVNMDGAPEASMGVDVADFDADGDPDIFLTHLNRQTNTIYVNDGTGFFSDATSVSGLGSSSVRFTSFGTAWIDYDNDTWLDLLVVSGDVQIIEELALKNDPYPIHQKNQLFRNLGNGRFKEISDESGSVFELSEVSRGAAVGDLDNDGDLDVVVTNNNGPVRLLRNEVGNAKSWIGLRLIDPGVGRDAIGARIAVHVKGPKPIWRRVRVDGSYGCSNDPRILVGLGDADAVEAVDVVWPDGSREKWTGLELGRYTTLEKGKGAKPATPGGAQP
jgi:hypothetical protein